jgi:hypothetical protein
MNVNSRGHNLDTKWSQLFPEIKHPPGLINPVGIPSSSDQLIIKPEGIFRLDQGDP